MSAFAYAKSGLVCLDLQRSRRVPDAGVLASCREVLVEARRRRWPILHVHARVPASQDGRPIEGLEPRPNEAVFVHNGPSAFSSPGFVRAAANLGGPLALIGCSLQDTVLATALAAADHGVPADIVRDAVGGEPVAALLQLLPPTARFIEIRDLFPEGVQSFIAANAP